MESDRNMVNRTQCLSSAKMQEAEIVSSLPSIPALSLSPGFQAVHRAHRRHQTQLAAELTSPAGSDFCPSLLGSTVRSPTACVWKP